MIDTAAVFLDTLDRSIRLLISRSKAARTAAMTEADRLLTFSVLEHALDAPEVWESCRILIRTVADQMEQAGHRQNWRGLLHWMLECSEQRDDTVMGAELLCLLGILAREEADLVEARRLLERAGGAARCTARPALLAKCLNRAAYVAAMERDFARAEELLEQAAELVAPDHAEAGYSYLVHGYLAELQRDWHACIALNRRGEQIFAAAGETRRAAVCHGNMGMGYWRLGRLDEALAIYREAIKQLDKLNDRTSRPIYQMNLACVLLELGDPQQALQEMRAAETGFRRTNARLNLARAQFNSGLIYRSMRAWDEGETAMLAGIAGFEALDNVAETVNALDDLALLLRAASKPGQADATFQRALNRLDRIPNDPIYPTLRARILKNRGAGAAMSSSDLF